MRVELYTDAEHEPAAFGGLVRLDLPPSSAAVQWNTALEPPLHPRRMCSRVRMYANVDVDAGGTLRRAHAPPLLDYVIVRLGEEWHGYDHAAVYARRADERALGLLVPRSLAGPKRHAALRAMRETAERVHELRGQLNAASRAAPLDEVHGAFYAQYIEPGVDAPEDALVYEQLMHIAAKEDAAGPAAARGEEHGRMREVASKATLGWLGEARRFLGTCVSIVICLFLRFLSVACERGSGSQSWVLPMLREIAQCAINAASVAGAAQALGAAGTALGRYARGLVERYTPYAAFVKYEKFVHSRGAAATFAKCAIRMALPAVVGSFFPVLSFLSLEVSLLPLVQQAVDELIGAEFMGAWCSAAGSVRLVLRELGITFTGDIVAQLTTFAESAAKYAKDPQSLLADIANDPKALERAYTVVRNAAAAAGVAVPWPEGARGPMATWAVLGCVAGMVAATAETRGYETFLSVMFDRWARLGVAHFAPAAAAQLLGCKLENPKAAAEQAERQRHMSELGVGQPEYEAMRAFFAGQWDPANLGSMYADFATGQILGLTYADLKSKEGEHAEFRRAIAAAREGNERALLDVTSNQSFIAFSKNKGVGTGYLGGLFRTEESRRAIERGARLAELLEVARGSGGRPLQPDQVGKSTQEAATILRVDAETAAKLGEIAARLAVNGEDAAALAMLGSLKVDAWTLERLGIGAQAAEMKAEREREKSEREKSDAEREEAERQTQAERDKAERERAEIENVEREKAEREKAEAEKKEAGERKAKGFFVLKLDQKKRGALNASATKLNETIATLKENIEAWDPDGKIDPNGALWRQYIAAREGFLAAARNATDQKDLDDITSRLPRTPKDLFLASSVGVSLGDNSELAVTRERALLGDDLGNLDKLGEKLKEAAAADPQHQLELALETGLEPKIQAARTELEKVVSRNNPGAELRRLRYERVAALQEYISMLGKTTMKMEDTNGLSDEAARYASAHKNLLKQLEISKIVTRLERQNVGGRSWNDLFSEDFSGTREYELERRNVHERPKDFPDEHVLVPRYVAKEQAPPEPSKEPQPNGRGAGPNDGREPKPESAPGPPPKKDGAPESAAKDAGPSKQAPEGLFAAASAAVSSVGEAGNAAVSSARSAAETAAAALGRAAETARILVAPTEEDLLRRDVAGHPEILAVLDRTRTEGADKNRILDEARAMAKKQGVAVEPYWRGEVALAPWVSQAEARSAEERLRAPPRIIASTAVAARVLVIGEYRGKRTARGLVAAHGAVATVGARQEKTFWSRLGAELASAYAPMVVAPLAAVFVAEDAVDAGAALAVELLSASGVAMVRLAAHCSDAPPDGSMHALGAFAAGGAVYVLSARDARRAIAHPYHKRRVERRGSRAARDAYAAEVRRATNWAEALDTLVDAVAAKGI